MLDGLIKRDHNRKETKMSFALNDKKRAEYIQFGHLSRIVTKPKQSQATLAMPLIVAGLFVYGVTVLFAS